MLTSPTTGSKEQFFLQVLKEWKQQKGRYFERVGKQGRKDHIKKLLEGFGGFPNYLIECALHTGMDRKDRRKQIEALFIDLVTQRFAHEGLYELLVSLGITKFSENARTPTPAAAVAGSGCLGYSELAI